jgi:hypothetical protein
VNTTGIPRNLFWKIVAPTTTIFHAFVGTPTNWGLTGFEVDGTVTRNFGIKASGLMTLPTTT